MDKRKIDFMAEREKRRNDSFADPESAYDADEQDLGVFAQEDEEPEDIPEYMKILYGADAARHMRAKAPQTRTAEPPTTAGRIPQENEVSEEQYDERETDPDLNAKRRNTNAGIYGRYDTAYEEDPAEFYREEEDEAEDLIENDGYMAEREFTYRERAREEAPAVLSPKEEKRRLREEKLDEKLREPIRPMSMDQKKRKRNAFLQLTAVILVTAAIIAVIISVVIGASRDSVYNLSYITEGDLVKTGGADAFFVRQTEILTAGSGGVFVPNVNEGDRVNVGYVVGYITKDEYVADLTQLRSIDRIILSMQSIGGFSPEMDMSELEAAEAKVSAIKKKLTGLGVTGRLENCGDILVELTAALNYYNDLLINADSDNASISQLQAEREVLAARLENNMTPVIASQAGIVSFHITGRESAENTVFQQLSANIPGDMGTFTAGTDIGSEPVYTVNGEVKSGDAVAKIITNQEYYIILNTDADYSEYLGNRIAITPVNSRYTVSGTIYGPNETERGKTLIVKSNKSLRATLSGSGASVQFDVSKTTGYRVPLTALGDWDKAGRTARIALVKANMVQFVYVTVVDTDENFAIIQNNTFANSDIFYEDTPLDENEAVFRANDCYIINAGKVREGQIIT